MKKMEILKDIEYNNTPKPKRVVSKRALSEKSIFELMEDVLMLTEKKKLSDVSLKQCDKQLQELSSRLELPLMACLFLSVIVDQGNVGGVEVADFAEFFDCRSMRIMGYNSLLTLLEQHGYIYSKGVFDFEGYKITNAAMEALKKNEPYHVPAIHNLTIDQFFSFLDDYFTDAEDENVSSELLQTRIDKLIEHNQELKLCQTINKYRNVSLSDRMSVVILLYLCHQLVNNNDEDVSVNEIQIGRAHV